MATHPAGRIHRRLKATRPGLTDGEARAFACLEILGLEASVDSLTELRADEVAECNRVLAALSPRALGERLDAWLADRRGSAAEERRRLVAALERHAAHLGPFGARVRREALERLTLDELRAEAREYAGGAAARDLAAGDPSGRAGLEALALPEAPP